jgi:hypothetical protein
MVVVPAAIYDWHYEKKTNKKQKCVAAQHKGLPGSRRASRIAEICDVLDFSGIPSSKVRTSNPFQKLKRRLSSTNLDSNHFRYTCKRKWKGILTLDIRRAGATALALLEWLNDAA